METMKKGILTLILTLIFAFLLGLTALAEDLPQNPEVTIPSEVVKGLSAGQNAKGSKTERPASASFLNDDDSPLRPSHGEQAMGEEREKSDRDAAMGDAISDEMRKNHR